MSMSARRLPRPDTHPHPAFPAMLAELAATPPSMFATDVTTHDARALRESDPSHPFAWYLYDRGSHLMRISRSFRPRDASDVRELVRTITRDFIGGRWFYWDGTSLRPVPSSTEIGALLLNDGAELRLCM
jgi:hypothetical protein